MKGETPFIAIVGPTASGKSEVAQCVAERIGAHVLSADSMQVYRGMDIGTGKVLPHQMRVVHHGLDLINPGEPFSAALYQEYGRAILDEAIASSRQVVICGGTGFYVRALVDDFDFPAGEQVGNAVRDRYNAMLEELGSHALWEELNAIDPASAEVIHENDSKRVVRAFELLAEGTSYREQREKFSSIPARYRTEFFGLQVSAALLNARIDERVDAMVADGLVDEVRALLDQGFREGLTAAQAIGYKEIVAYLEGRCTLDEAKGQIKVATHRYAKRQRTWFRKDARIRWIEADEYEPGFIADQIIERFTMQGGVSCNMDEDW